MLAFFRFSFSCKLPINQQYYVAVKKLKLKQTKNISGWEMKSPSGKILTNIDDILENWARFYENLYHSDWDKFIPLAEEKDFEIPHVMKTELDILCW